MNDWHNFFNPLSQFLNQGNYRIFESDSKDEILHWFSREDIPQQQKEDFIEALLDFDDGCGGFYGYRAYFLAAEALAYFPNSCFGDVIVEQLLNWAYVYFGWEIVPKPLRYAAREALKVTDKPRVIKVFTHLLHTTTSRLTLRQAAVELGLLDPGNKIAIAALNLLLQVTKIENSKTILFDATAKDKEKSKQLPESREKTEYDDDSMCKSIALHWEEWSFFDVNIPVDNQSLLSSIILLDDICRIKDVAIYIRQLHSENETAISCFLRGLEITKNQKTYTCLYPRIAEALTVFPETVELGINVLYQVAFYHGSSS